jgi:predicted O-methyltransferase YrrM
MFAADRKLLQQIGGFDMMFSGRHAGEDQYLARRLAKFTHDSDAIYVHEPPFAWHPEENIGWDDPRDSNVCAGPHQVVNAEIQGIATHRCVRCPFYWVPDETIINGNASMPFDVSLTSSRMENFGAAPKAFNEVFGLGEEECRAAATTDLENAYGEYVKHISSPDRAISLQMAAFLSALCERHRPVSILDLGSGFSSFVFRAYAQTHAAVWTVDDDPNWLERTAQFLTARLVPTNNMALWQEGGWRDEGFDLVCYDLGGMTTRAQALPEILQKIGDTTILVLDDMHKEEYVPTVERELRTGQWRYFDARSHTMDHYGRFCGVVLRATHPLLR